MALEDMSKWLDSEGEVSVFDATNTTRERRALIHNFCVRDRGYRLLFVESVCDDVDIIEENILVSKEWKHFVEFNDL
jgi:hypothetical protein